MTDEQRKKKEPKRPSARLAITPDDEWRSWSKLPPKSAAEEEFEDEYEDEDEVDLEDLSRFSGSMMVVGGPGDVDQEGAPSTPAQARRAKNSERTAAFERAKAEVLQLRGEREAARAEFAKLYAERDAAKAQIAQLTERVQQQAATIATAEQAIATAEQVIAAERSARAEAEKSATTHAAAAVAATEQIERLRTEASGHADERQHALEQAVATAQAEVDALRRELDQARQQLEEQRAEHELELASERRRATAYARSIQREQEERADSTPGTPNMSSTPSATAAPESDSAVGRFIAAAAATIERQTGRREAETTAVLAELFERHGSELGLNGGLDPAVEDRIRTSFLQLAQRIERIEKQANSVSVVDRSGASTGVERSEVVELGSKQTAIAAELETLRAEVTKVREGHRSLAKQHIQLAEVERNLVDQQDETERSLADILGQVGSLAEQVKSQLVMVPALERRTSVLDAELRGALDRLGSNVDQLAERLPGIEDAAELARHTADGLIALQETVVRFNTKLERDLNALTSQMAGLPPLEEKVDGLVDDVSRAISTSDRTAADFARLQAEVDRHTDGVEGRLLELEDVVGNEAGVDRQLVLDRLEELERGITELDPARFATADEVGELRHRIAASPPEEHG